MINIIGKTDLTKELRPPLMGKDSSGIFSQGYL